MPRARRNAARLTWVLLTPVVACSTPGAGEPTPGSTTDTPTTTDDDGSASAHGSTDTPASSSGGDADASSSAAPTDTSADDGSGTTDDPGVESGTLIARADWSQHGLTPDTLMPGATWFVYGEGCSQIDDTFRISYPDTSAGGTSAGLSLQLDASWDLPEIYVEFDARLPAGPIGPKFYKVHGDGGGTEYANTTYGLGAGDASMYISFGDGTTTGNDAANVIFLDGSNPTWIGRNFGIATVTLADPPAPFHLDDQWHSFRIRHRYNSGTSPQTETNDGIFHLEIDGVVRVDAVDLFNRHPLNLRRVNILTFGDWVQNDAAAVVDLRDVKVSVGGWPP